MPLCGRESPWEWEAAEADAGLPPLALVAADASACSLEHEGSKCFTVSNRPTRPKLHNTLARTRPRRAEGDPAASRGRRHAHPRIVRAHRTQRPRPGGSQKTLTRASLSSARAAALAVIWAGCAVLVLWQDGAEVYHGGTSGQKVLRLAQAQRQRAHALGAAASRLPPASYQSSRLLVCCYTTVHMHQSAQAVKTLRDRGCKSASCSGVGCHLKWVGPSHTPAEQMHEKNATTSRVTRTPCCCNGCLQRWAVRPVKPTGSASGRTTRAGRRLLRPTARPAAWRPQYLGKKARSAVGMLGARARQAQLHGAPHAARGVGDWTAGCPAAGQLAPLRHPSW